jgi:outer membrane protease
MNPYMIEAEAMRKSISGLAEGADDETLIDNKDAFPYWNGNGVKYEAGFLVKDIGELYQVIQPHTSQLDWQPSTTPALFKKVSLDEFPEWRQPTGAQDAYMKGDKCSHKDKHWISDIDSNVWEPSVYGWSEVQSDV